jgi:glycosyltransferase involved in cell wall biosynthesis
MEKKHPKISVVTPSFNQGDYIEGTINSVLNQDYPDLEYIIIDGNSSDNTKEVIKKYGDQLSYWVSEPDKGHADALNKGFERTSGEIMSWINSDDTYMPWTFKTVAEIFAKFPEVNWLVGINSGWDQHGRLIKTITRPKNIYDYLQGDYKWIQQESVFWRRSLWEKAGGHISRDYKLMIDGELWGRFFLHDKLYVVENVIGGFRRHETNRSLQNFNLVEEEMMKVIETLKEKSKPEVLSTYRKLKLLNPIGFYFGFKNKKHSRKHRVYPIHSLVKSIFPSLYKKVAYHFIIRKEGEWALKKRSYFKY